MSKALLPGLRHGGGGAGADHAIARGRAGAGLLERLSAEAKGAIGMQVSAELEAERRATRDAIEEAKRIKQSEGLPQMPLDQWSRKRGGIEAGAAIMNRWREPEPTTQEK